MNLHLADLIDTDPCSDCAMFDHCRANKLACKDFQEYCRGKADFPKRVPTRAIYNLIFEES